MRPAGAQFLPEIKACGFQPVRLSLKSHESTRGLQAMTISDVADVGAPDPELKNSPVVDSEIEEGEFSAIDQDVQVCYFNGVRYASGDYVCSGHELLRCENGVWVRAGSRSD
jgi:hypothetical protein